MRIRLVDAVTGLSTWLKGSGGAANVVLYGTDGEPITSLGSASQPKSLNTAGIANVSYTDTSASLELSTIGAVAGDTLRIYAPTDIYIEFGSSAPTADSNSMYFAAGTEKVVVPASATHLAIIRVTSNGTANIQVMV